MYIIQTVAYPRQGVTRDESEPKAGNADHRKANSSATCVQKPGRAQTKCRALSWRKRHKLFSTGSPISKSVNNPGDVAVSRNWDDLTKSEKIEDLRREVLRLIEAIITLT